MRQFSLPALTFFLLLSACDSSDEDIAPKPGEMNEADSIEQIEQPDPDVAGGESADGESEEVEEVEEVEEEIIEPPPATIWTGPLLTFEKVSETDSTDAANQDQLTDKVSLTRGNKGALINVVAETRPTMPSPTGTLWAEGVTSEIESLKFLPLKAAANDAMKKVPGKSFVLHLTEENIYIDVKFLSWKSGVGGGFSYERSTPAP